MTEADSGKVLAVLYGLAHRATDEYTILGTGDNIKSIR